MAATRRDREKQFKILNSHTIPTCIKILNNVIKKADQEGYEPYLQRLELKTDFSRGGPEDRRKLSELLARIKISFLSLPAYPAYKSNRIFGRGVFVASEDISNILTTCRAEYIFVNQPQEVLPELLSDRIIGFEIKCERRDADYPEEILRYNVSLPEGFANSLRNYLISDNCKLKYLKICGSGITTEDLVIIREGLLLKKTPTVLLGEYAEDLAVDNPSITINQNALDWINRQGSGPEAIVKPARSGIAPK